MNSHDRQPALQLLRPVELTGIVAAAILVAAVVTATWLSYRGHSASERQIARQHAEDMALVLHANSRDILLSVDDAVMHVKEAVERNGLRADLAGILQRHRDIANHVALISVADTGGLLVQSTLPIPPGTSIADLAHFRVHVDRDSGQPFINRPIRGRVSGKWSFHMTRRINRPDGAFGGVAIVAIDLSYWERLLQQGHFGQVGTVALVGQDGVARAVFGNDKDALMAADWGFLDQIGAAGAVRTAVGGPASGGAWVYRDLEGYPLRVAVSLDESAISLRLASIRNWYLGGAAAMILLILLLTAALLLYVARQRTHLVEVAALEEARRLSEERLRTIADHIDEGLALYDTDDRLEFFNEGFRRIQGDATPDVRVGLPFRALVEDRARLLAAHGEIDDVDAFVRERMAQRRSEDADVIERKRISGGYHLIREAHTAAGQTITTYVDISHLKRREAELRESEQRFRAIFDHAGIGITMRPAHDRHHPWEAVNDHFCEMTGYSRAELLRMSTADITAPDWQERARSDNARLLAGEIRSYTREKRIIRRNGSLLWVQFSVSVLPDAQGLPDRVIATYQDIDARKQAEERLRDSENWFRAMFDHAGIGMSTRSASDRNAPWLAVNDKFCEMLGYTRTEMLQLSTAAVTVPEEQDVAIRDNRRMVSGEVNGISREKQLICKGGRVIWVTMSMTLLRDAAGEPYRFIATYQDIGARKQAEHQLRESENRLRAIIAAEPECVAIVAPDGALLDMNPAGLQMLQAESLEEMQRWPFLQLILPQYRRSFVRLQLRVLAGRSGRLEFEALGISGRHCWLEIHAAPLRDGAGRITALLGIARDVTERRKAREALAAERNLLRTVIDNLPDRIRVRDLNMRLMLANETWRRLRAPNHSDVVGLTNDDLQPSDVVGRYAHEDREVAATGVASTPREVMDGSPDNPSWFVTTKLPLRGANNEIVGVVAISRDVTDFKRRSLEVEKLNAALEARVAERTAQLTSANEELEAFAASVSHDLRAPLRHIDGLSVALVEDHADRLDASARGHVERIRAAARRMTNLIEDLLRLSRVTRAEPRFAEVDLSEMARGIAEDLRRDQPGRAVIFDITPGLHCRADAGLLRAALFNLMQNAWKFTARTETALIEVGAVQRQGLTAYFVRDNGAGFDMAYADRLFGAFQRLHSDQEFAGTGIGLATVRRIMRRHGGDAWAESAVGRGAIFFFTLQGRAAVAPAAAPVPPVAPVADVPPTPPTVLLVDDDPDVLALSSRALGADGYVVLTAGTGEAALAILGERPVTVIVSDFSMPGINGAQLLAQAAKLQPDTLRMIVSGQTMNRAMQAGLRNGEIHHYFEKQHSYDAVRACIRQWLDITITN